jgi:hypothetical protein
MQISDIVNYIHPTKDKEIALWQIKILDEVKRYYKKKFIADKYRENPVDTILSNLTPEDLASTKE